MSGYSIQYKRHTIDRHRVLCLASRCLPRWSIPVPSFIVIQAIYWRSCHETRPRNARHRKYMMQMHSPSQARERGLKTYARLSRDSSRTISSSREPSPLAHVSIQVSHNSSCSTKDHGRVQSRTIRIRAWGREVRGGRKCGRRDKCEGEEDGTVYTERRARVSATSDQQAGCISIKSLPPSSASSLTSAQSYPRAKSVLSGWASSSCFPSNPAAMADRPEDFSPRISICLEGIDRVDDTESRIEDHRFSTGSVSTTSTIVDIL